MALPHISVCKSLKQIAFNFLYFYTGGYPENPGPNPANPGGLSADDCLTIENFSKALCFAFRTDNSGPPMSVTVS